MPKPKYYILILILVLTGSYIFLESTAQQPIDWTYSYWKTHDKPFGAEVFHEVFAKHQKQVEEIDVSPYEFLSEGNYEGSYLMFNSGLFIGQYDTEKILDWVEDGNTLFMSAEYLPGLILDTLGLDRENFTFKNQISYKPSVSLDTVLNQNKYKFDRNLNIQYFKNTDTLDIEVLGYTQFTNKDSTASKTLPNFVKAEFGTGYIYLHLFPQAFTNYFLVDSINADYTKDILKHLDYNKTIYVDQFYKDQKEIAEQHILQYLISNRYLKWAYYLILLTGIIYIFFEGKRKQKPIKVVKPYENKTYAFTKTIADMYFRKQDHKSIATKQIEHFYDYVRDQYRISTAVLDDDFVHQLASKSGQSVKRIKSVLKNIKTIENQKNISKETLLRLEKQISILKN
jgi:hypothetical protein